jgi:Leucine-rich repeat (LRR) protein
MSAQNTIECIRKNDPLAVRVSLTCCEITDLSFLEHNTTIIHLNLCGNQIRDLSPLKDNSCITYLALTYNQIDNINALKNNNTITHLFLGYNQITDLSPLKDNTIIEVLSIEYNSFDISECISVLAHNTSVISLTIEGDQYQGLRRNIMYNRLNSNIRNSSYHYKMLRLVKKSYRPVFVVT